MHTCSLPDFGDMTNAKLAAKVARKFRPTNRQAEATVGIFLARLTKALRGGDKAELQGFGGCGTRSRIARQRRNPRTGSAIPVPAQGGTLLQDWQGTPGK